MISHAHGSSVDTAATCLWLQEDLSGCHASLQKLELERKTDARVTLNTLVVEHALYGSEAELVRAQLDSLIAGRLAAEDGGAADGGSQAARPRSSGTSEPLPLLPVRDDVAVAKVNVASLLHYQHRHAEAAAVLEQLTGNVEALAEGTAVRVLTLLLDIYIEAQQLPRAVAVLDSFERLYAPLTEAYAADRAGGDAHGAAGQAGGQGRAANGAAGTGLGQGSGGAVVGAQPRVLVLPRVSRWCNGVMARCKVVLGQQGFPPAVPDLKLLIKLYRSRLHALAHNTRAAKRELKAVISALHQGPAAGASAAGHAATQAPAEPRVGSAAAGALLLTVRAQLELYRGRVKKATRLLLSMMQDPALVASHRPLLLNNLGLVHHQQGKHTLALLYMSQAMAHASAGQPPRPPGAAQGSALSAGEQPASVQSAPAGHAGAAAPAAAAVPLPAVLYNAGLQHLLLQNFTAARQCFTEAAAHYDKTPLLWLRTAEAALGLYRLEQRQHQQQQEALLGAGPHPLGGPLAEGGVTSAAFAQDASAPALAGGAAPSAREMGPGAASLLSEAAVALQTALQQLDAQEEAHDQWQSSSSRLGVSLAMHSAASAAPPGAGGAESVGGSNGSTEVVPDLYLPLPPYGQQNVEHFGRQQQEVAGAAGASVDDARCNNSSHPTANGVQEPQGTDATAALFEELLAIRRAVLANLAYAQLQAEDFEGALQAAQALMAAASAYSTPSSAAGSAAATTGTGAPATTPSASASEYAFLANSYTAEALCHLGRPADAVECLSLWLMQAQESDAQQGLALQAPTHSCGSQKSDEDGGGGVREVYPLGNAAALAALTGPGALATTYVNLGAVFAGQGELVQAAALVRQALALQPMTRGAYMLLVYCELAAGNTAAALALLRGPRP